MWGRTRSVERDNSVSRVGERFVARRRRRRRALIASGIPILILLAGLVYALNQSFMRIVRVQVVGLDSANASVGQAITSIAEARMQGSYFGIIPRNATLFYPGALIRTDILAAYPDVAAVSLSHDGLTGLSIKVSDRVPIALWCGTAPSANDLATSTSISLSPCSVFDASGFVYATTTLDQPVNSFRFYEPVSSSTGASVLDSTLPNAPTFPSAFDFARELGTLGSPVVAVVYRDGEVDDYLASGTRITYVLGNEQNAFTALTSAHVDFNLTDGSVDYVDLRFDGEVYIKPKDATVH